mmetsp:Transcript_98630/g.175654  ORF Transcript_98630/g.175654 Transcript_98630/m.175654 type:complete len:158 (+) Transcript_98630:69-542(+)
MSLLRSIFILACASIQEAISVEVVHLHERAQVAEHATMLQELKETSEANFAKRSDPNFRIDAILDRKVPSFSWPPQCPSEEFMGSRVPGWGDPCASADKSKGCGNSYVQLGYPQMACVKCTTLDNACGLPAETETCVEETGVCTLIVEEIHPNCCGR